LHEIICFVNELVVNFEHLEDHIGKMNFSNPLFDTQKINDIAAPFTREIFVHWLKKTADHIPSLNPLVIELCQQFLDKKSKKELFEYLMYAQIFL